MSIGSLKHYNQAPPHGHRQTEELCADSPTIAKVVPQTTITIATAPNGLLL